MPRKKPAKTPADGAGVSYQVGARADRVRVHLSGLEGRTFEFSFPITVLRPRTPLGTGKPASKRHRAKAANPDEYEHQRRQDPERREYHRNYQQERRQKRITAGLSTRCPAKAILGETYCETCRDFHKSKRAEYEEARNQQPERKETARLIARRTRQERNAAGLYRDCSHQAIAGQTRCEVCRDKHRASRQLYDAKRRAQTKNSASTAPPGNQ